MDKVLCLYHKDCIDGHAAAWVVGHAMGFENVEFVPVGHGKELPLTMAGRRVVMVDFMFNDPTQVPSETLRNMGAAKSVWIFDHHESAWANWKDVPLPSHWYYRYEPNLSGVGVVWKHFFGQTEMPMALQLIQDRDLWQFQVNGSREFHEVAISHGLLSALPAEDSWLGRMVNYELGLCGDLNELMPEIRAEGQAIIRSQKVFLQSLLKRARIIHVAGYEVPLCNVPYDLRSEAGFWLSLKYPFSVTYDDMWNDGLRRYSIRSNKKTGINVVPIAEAFGGGGHKHAAAFTQPVDDDPLFRVPSWGVQLKLEFEEPT